MWLFCVFNMFNEQVRFRWAVAKSLSWSLLQSPWLHMSNIDVIRCSFVLACVTAWYFSNAKSATWLYYTVYRCICSLFTFIQHTGLTAVHAWMVRALLSSYNWWRRPWGDSDNSPSSHLRKLLSRHAAARIVSTSQAKVGLVLQVIVHGTSQV